MANLFFAILRVIQVGLANTCMTGDCKRAADMMLENRNPHQDHCVNFYEYACANFVATHPLTPTQQVHKQIDIQLNTLNERIAELLSTQDDSALTAVQNARMAYWNCVTSSNQPTARIDCLQPIKDQYPRVLLYLLATPEVYNQKEKLLGMFRYIKQAFVETIQNSWLNDNSKAIARNQITRLTVIMGFTPEMVHPNNLEKPYLLSYKLFELYCAYHPTENVVFVPISAFFFPTNQLGLEALNFAAVGFAIAHEMSHSFGSIGRRVGNWWSRNMQNMFFEKSECFKQQYTRFTLLGQQISTFTLEENIADNVGFQLALDAYSLFTRRGGPEKKLIKFEMYRHHKLFMLAFANKWCEHVTVQAHINDVRTGHAPAPARVNGVIMNAPEFGELWNCPPDSPMNPVHKWGQPEYVMEGYNVKKIWKNTVVGLKCFIMEARENNIQIIQTGSTNTCMTGDCRRAADMMLRNRNIYQDHCANFYEYACANFRATHPLTPTKQFHKMYEIQLNILNEQIAELLSIQDDSALPAVQNARAMYWNCIVTSGRPTARIDCLQPIKEQYPRVVLYLLATPQVHIEKENLRRMFRYIKQAFVDTIQNSWMDDNSKTIATNQISSVTVIMRFTTEMVDPNNLENPYLLPYKLFEFYCAYHPTENVVFVPIGAFFYPTNQLGLHALNFSIIGFSIAHELSHSFGTIGRRLGNWWSRNMQYIFNHKSECFRRQYDQFSVQGQQISTLTLEENIADNVGFHLVQDAYRLFTRRNGPEKKLIRFENYDHHKLFMLAFANKWCEHVTEQAHINDVRSGHAPAPARVNGVIMNSPEFGELWNCPPNSPMNPVNKCSIFPDRIPNP